MRRIPSLIICGLALHGAAKAQDQARIEAIATAWSNWADAQNIGDGAIAITWQGEVVFSAGRGIDPETPVELASLSKAITAICLSDLVGQGVISYESTGADILGLAGQPGQISVAQFLTHTSGLAEDTTQLRMPFWFGDSAPRWTAVMNVLGDRALGTTEFVYNNENYAALGSLIEAATGLPYAEACAPSVAAYPTAALSRQTGSYGPFGGWVMSVTDYASFHASMFGGQPPSGPTSDAGGGALYGLGTFQRPFDGSWNAWHFGLLCMPGRIEAGSFAVNLRGEWGIVVAFDRCKSWDVLGTLDAALVGAALGDLAQE